MIAPFKCTYCGQPSWIDPADQVPPLDYCQDIDHGTGEAGNDERDALVAENEMLRAALRAIVDEVSEGLVPYSSDSYLPSHLVEQARAALDQGLGC